MKNLTLGIPVLILLLYIWVPLISGVFKLRRDLAFALSPVVYVSLNAGIHNVLVLFGKNLGFETSYSRTIYISVIVWLTVGLLYFYKSKEIARFTSSISTLKEPRAWRVPMLVAVSLLVWLLGLGFTLNPPKDNDALSNAFISARILTQENKPLCIISSDVTRETNLRFESCGSFVLTHSTNFFNSSPNDQLLSLAFLLTAIFLPIGAAASFSYFGGRKSASWIASLVSISFLLYPYGVNGLLRLSLALSLVLPILALCIDYQNLSIPRMALLAVCFVGLGYVHLLPVVTVISFYLISVVISFIQVLKLNGFKAKVLSASRVSLRLLAVIPSYLLFFKNTAIRQSAENVVAIAQSQITMVSAPTAEQIGSDKNLLEVIERTLKILFLENDWTRAQPLLVVLSIIGLYHFLKNNLVKGLTLSITLLGLYTLWVGVEFNNYNGMLFSRLFIGEWYRLIAVTEVFLIPSASLGLCILLNRLSRQRALAKVANCLIVFGLLISVATGSSIVRTAWQRDNRSMSEVPRNLELLLPWKDLRTLNDPSDGSAWAYSKIGSNLVNPNDRGEFLVNGRLISTVQSDSDIQKFNVLVKKEGAQAVLGIGRNTRNIRRLYHLGLVREFLIDEPNLVFGLLK